MYLDAKLHWHKHQRIILQKAQKALSSLSRTSYSTWSFPVLTACLVYTAILRSVLSYAVGIWFNPLRKSSNISSLIIFQNKCLRLIGGAFKATPSFLLESELFLLPLDLYFKFYTVCFLSSIQQRQQVSFNPQDFTTIISNPELLQKFLYWFMSLKRLNQFNLAFKLHYSQSNT